MRLNLISLQKTSGIGIPHNEVYDADGAHLELVYLPAVVVSGFACDSRGALLVVAEGGYVATVPGWPVRAGKICQLITGTKSRVAYALEDASLALLAGSRPSYILVGFEPLGINGQSVVV